MHYKTRSTIEVLVVATAERKGRSVFLMRHLEISFPASGMETASVRVSSVTGHYNVSLLGKTL